MKLIIFFAFSLLFGTSVLSQPTNPPVDKNATVFFINGIGKSDEGQVFRDINRLRQTLREFCPRYNQRVQLLFNESNGTGVTGVLQDIFFDVARQRLAEAAVPFASTIFNVVSATYGFANSLTENEVRDLNARFVSDANRAIVSVDSVDKQNRFSQIVNSSITQSRSALIVSHSQGNLYANGVHADLSASGNRFFQGGLHILSVASPSSFTPYGNHYTSIQDLVINGLRVLPLPPPLPGNVDLTGFERFDRSGHNFVDVYLSGELPNGSLGRTSSAGRIVSRNVNQGFREIYRRVDANGRQVVADSSSNSPCDR